MLLEDAAVNSELLRRRPVIEAYGQAQVGWCAEAEEDCNRALQLEAPVLNPKTLLRRATARVALHQIRAARADYKQVTAATAFAAVCKRMFTI
jgi:hypothetical protein